MVPLHKVLNVDFEPRHRRIYPATKLNITTPPAHTPSPGVSQMAQQIMICIKLVNNEFRSVKLTFIR